MPELRRDIVRNIWVVSATEQALEPQYFPINSNGSYIHKIKVCPFCEGNEALTPPEIAAFRKEGTLPDTPGWIVRTIPSKYSAFNMEGEFQIEEYGLYQNCSSFGKQEVVVGNPDHNVDLHHYSPERIELILRMFQQRYRALADDRRIKYIQIYKNSGLFAGASQEHSHSQIIALPLVPSYKQITSKFFQDNGECLICSIMEKEQKFKERLVFASDYFLLLCPFASRFSYETWIIPKYHRSHFSDISEPEIKDLANTFKRFLNTMLDSLNNPAYNIVINTAAVNVPYQEGHHWFMEVNPRFIVSNGFEISSGYYTNPVAPELSASLLRKRMDDNKISS